MTALTALLRRQSEQNPNAAYFNVDILKYNIKTKPGAGSCPFQLVSYWKCEQNHTDLKIDYKYNLHAMSSPSPLLNVSVAVPVDGGVSDLHSMPSAVWYVDIGCCKYYFVIVILFSGYLKIIRAYGNLLSCLNILKTKV